MLVKKPLKVSWLKVAQVATVFLIYALIGLALFAIYRHSGFTITDLQSYLNSLGIWAYIIFIALQVLTNVFLFIIPGQTLQFIALGLTLFSPLVTFFLVLIGMVIASFINFMIGRFLGKKVVTKIIGEDTYNKYENKLTTKAYVYYPVMMILPFFPDDEITLLVGLTKMNVIYFLITTIFTRAVGVAIFTFVPGQIVFSYQNPLELTLLIFGIIYVVLLLFYLIRQVEKTITRLLNK